MEYENLIYDFVEGKLDNSQEQEFFLAMASNEDLRSELKQTMALESAFRKDAGSLKPTTRSTVRLFTSLGLPIPAAVGMTQPLAAAAVNTTAASPVKVSLLAKFTQAIFSAFITGTAAVAVYLFVIKPGTDRLEANYYNVLAENGTLAKTLQVRGAEKSEIPVISSNGADIRQTTPHVNLRNRQNDENNSDIAVSNSNNNKSKIGPVRPENETIAESINRNTNANTKPAGKEIQTSGIRAANYLPVADRMLFNIVRSIEPIFAFDMGDTYEKIGLKIEFKGIGESPITEVKPKVTNTENSFFSNTGLTVLKNIPAISDNFYIGADIRKESFYQKWTGIKKENGLRYRFEQNHSSVSAGAVIRYIFLDSEYFGAFAQAIGGINDAGYVGRGLIGFKISYTDQFYFIVALEASKLWYTGSGNPNQTTKAGLNYGIGFNY